MTSQEQDMISGLIDRINQTQLPEKDTEAEQLLQQQLGRNPDALYILAQTVLVQKYALEQAQKQLADTKAQMEQVRQQAQQPKHSTSFLGSIFGSDEKPAASAPAPPPPLPATSQAQYAPVPGYPQQGGYGQPPNYGPQAGYGQPQGYPQAGPSFGAPAGGGFLRSAMQTATGVAAGALAFEGIESLMHGFGHGGGGFGGGSAFGDTRQPEVINNYYEEGGRQNHDGLSSDVEDRRGEHDGGGFYNASGDASRDGGNDTGDQSGFFNATDSDTADDTAGAGDYGDNSSDDTGSDGGGGDFGDDGSSSDSSGDDSNFS